MPSAVKWENVWEQYLAIIGQAGPEIRLHAAEGIPPKRKAQRLDLKALYRHTLKAESSKLRKIPH